MKKHVNMILAPLHWDFVYSNTFSRFFFHLKPIYWQNFLTIHLALNF